MIVILSIINILSIIAIFILISHDYGDLKYEYDTLRYDYNNENRNKLNSTYSHNNKNINHIPIRNYFFDTSSYLSSIIILNSLSLFFWLLLICSFCSGESECYCEGSCCSGSCGNCNGCNCSNNGETGQAALVCLVFICLILIIYYALKCCGKHLARYISISSTAFIHLCILFFSMLVFDGRNNQLLQIMICSGISFVINILTILLPNLSSCEILRFKSRIPSSEVINYNINQNPNQISQVNNNINVNNNMNNNYNNAPYPANYVVYPNNGQPNSVPIVANEYNNANQNVGRNASIESNDQFVVDNNNFGNAPLPAYEMQVKN